MVLAPVRVMAMVVILLVALAAPAVGARSKARLRPAGDDRTPVTVEVAMLPKVALYGAAGRRAVATVHPIPDGGTVRIRAFDQDTDAPTFDSGPLDIDPETGTARESLTDSPIVGGTHRLVATFSGTPYFAPATSEPATFTVSLVPTTVELRVAAQRVEAGEPLDIRIVADTPARAPAVLLVDGEPTVSGFGQASPGFWLDGLYLPPGRHVLKARFLGDPNRGIGASVSEPVEVVVGTVRGPTDGIAIDADRPTTGSRDVAVGIGLASGDRTVTQVRLSPTATLVDGLLEDGTTFPEAATIDWTLPAGDDGQRIVHAQFHYGDGSWSGVVSDDIYLDRTAPEGTIVINDGAEQIGDPWPNRGIDEPTFRSKVWDAALDWGGRIAAVAYTYDDSRWFYRPAYGSSWPGGFTTFFDPLTSAPDKPMTIVLKARFRDSAGNWSETVTDTIELVWRLPVARILIDGKEVPEYGAVDRTSITLTVHTVVIPPEGVETILVGGCEGGKVAYPWRQDRRIDVDLTDGRFIPIPGVDLRELCVRLVTTTDRDRTIPVRVFVDRVIPLADAPVPAFALDAEVQVDGPAAARASTTAIIAWNGRDDRKVGGFRAQRSLGSAAWAPIALPKPLTRRTQQPVRTGDAYRYRVRTIDAAGNAGAWKTGAPFSMEMVPDDSPRIVYRGPWRTQAQPEALGGSLHLTGGIGASASLTFTGRAIAWVAPKGTNGDLVSVYVDGKLLKKVNLWLSAGVHHRRVVLSVAWAKAGKHTVKLVHRHTGHQLPVDAFLVLR